MQLNMIRIYRFELAPNPSKATVTKAKSLISEGTNLALKQAFCEHCVTCTLGGMLFGLVSYGLTNLIVQAAKLNS